MVKHLTILQMRDHAVPEMTPTGKMMAIQIAAMKREGVSAEMERVTATGTLIVRALWFAEITIVLGVMVMTAVGRHQ